MRFGAIVGAAALALVASGCSCSTTHERSDDAGHDAVVFGDDTLPPPDAFVPADAFASPDAFVPVDAGMDAPPSDTGVAIDGAMCDFVGAFTETTAGFVTTLHADGTWETTDAGGGMASGMYARMGDTITFTNTGGCSGTYHFVGNGCDAFTLVFLSSDCGSSGTDLTYRRSS